jgi:hypothetical protein
MSHAGRLRRVRMHVSIGRAGLLIEERYGNQVRKGLIVLISNESSSDNVTAIRPGKLTRQTVTTAACPHGFWSD